MTQRTNLELMVEIQKILGEIRELEDNIARRPKLKEYLDSGTKREASLREELRYMCPTLAGMYYEIAKITDLRVPISKLNLEKLPEKERKNICSIYLFPTSSIDYYQIINKIEGATTSISFEDADYNWRNDEEFLTKDKIDDEITQYSSYPFDKCDKCPCKECNFHE